MLITVCPLASASFLAMRRDRDSQPMCIQGDIHGSTRRTGEILQTPVWTVVSHEGCVLWLCVSQKGKNSSSFFDFRMTIKCAVCSCHFLMPWPVFTRSLAVVVYRLYLMHMRLINDAVYHEGSRRLINNMRLIARCA